MPSESVCRRFGVASGYPTPPGEVEYKKDSLAPRRSLSALQGKWRVHRAKKIS